jgi:hypothetical protein
LSSGRVTVVHNSSLSVDTIKNSITTAGYRIN